MKKSQAVGLMTTASHNLVVDNGVKLIDPDGSMLEIYWEAYAVELANAKDVESFILSVKKIMKKEEIELKKLVTGVILVGRDTRPHSNKLMCLAISAASCFQFCTILNLGVVTTPQLHFAVKKFNFSDICLPLEDPRKVLISEAYCNRLSSSFKELVDDASMIPTLYVDVGYGVGGISLKEISSKLELKIEIINFASDEEMKNRDTYIKLNNGCGAEFVQKQKKLPLGFEDICGTRYISFDGDADRIVYFLGKDDHFSLFDGDKIACLFIKFILENLSKIKPNSFDKKLSICNVQTAYANGASSNYVKNALGSMISEELGSFSCKMVKTGVKHLHHEAINHDVGVYFEANGHGTVVFSSYFLKTIKQLTIAGDSVEAKALYNFSQLINDATGDAIADFLCIEAVLHKMKMTKEKWARFYIDLPSLMTKTKVKDRFSLKVNDTETRILVPSELQQKIDEIVKIARTKEQSDLCRCFVRPSGTEDVVRIYAEARTNETAAWLNSEVKKVVSSYLN